MEIGKLTPEVIKQAILELTQPVIFKNIINNYDDVDNNAKRWNLLSLENLRRILGEMQLNFRVGENARTSEPQWDLNCPTETMTMSEFLEKIEENDKKWYYFDYKYMQEWFKDKPEVLSAVDWRSFGFDKKGEDSTFWIGSRGAHTHCHQDAYGCNLVAQIHGKKQWLLFPPKMNTALQETRIPYEESTIYSKYNFFCPSKKEQEVLKNNNTPIRVILQPGEVLFVPKGWWHFVESLELSISVNVWLPLDSDCEARLKEALVKLIVRKIGEGLPAVEEDAYSIEELMSIIKKCKEDCESLKNYSKNDVEAPKTKKMKTSPWTADDLSQKYPNFVKKLDFMSHEEFVTFLENQRERFSEETDTKNTENPLKTKNAHQSVLKSVTEALCHSDVITKVAELLLKGKIN